MEFPSFSQAVNIPAGWIPPDKNNEITLQIGAAETETLDVARFYIGSKELLLDKTETDSCNGNALLHRFCCCTDDLVFS